MLSVLLIDRNQPLVDAWDEAFEAFDEVEARKADFFDHAADAVVSPANSFGFMDGGLDQYIMDTLSNQIEARVQAVVTKDFHGEVPVGNAFIVPTQREPWRFLVVAPTMRVPESCANTLNAYLAFRATLLSITKHNASAPVEEQIRSVAVPGLGTGIGGMEPRKCAAQMRIAWNQVRSTGRIPSFDTIHETHRKMKVGL